MPQETRARPHVDTVRYAKVRFEVTAGPDAGLRLEAAGRTLRLGTADDNDLVLSDDTVSRRHCEFELGETAFRVVDLGSTNGVRMLGARIADASFQAPVELTIGVSKLTITPLSSTEDREQADLDRFGDLLGESPGMRELFAQLERFAPTQLSVLIEGETGTGKDVVAEAIHRHSTREAGPYVVFDCGAVAPTLIESELFGHEKGAFTGASGSRPGVFEEASGGTLFLDELGELPKELQPKLLRVLEKQQVRRLGGRVSIDVNVRVVAATNRNLLAEVQRGTFRQDLYYRIAGTKVRVPPLRERRQDIPLLVRHFLSREQPSIPLHAVSENVWEMLAAHRWPGNVRELRNAVQRLAVAPEFALRVGQTDEVSIAEPGTRPAVPAAVLQPLRIARREAAEAFERDYLVALLRQAGGSVTRAAGIAEVSRQIIHKLMRKHDTQP